MLAVQLRSGYFPTAFMLKAAIHTPYSAETNLYDISALVNQKEPTLSSEAMFNNCCTE